MFKVCKCLPAHGKHIADFQCKMALETEKLQLNPQLTFEGTDYLIGHQKYGFYLVALHSQTEEPIGSLLVTFQNAESWWIQSVYVVPEHRRKGIFTSMFQRAIQEAKISNSKSIKLYVEVQNQQAKKTYIRLGMHCSGEKFYGYDLVYGNKTMIDQFKEPISPSITFSLEETKTEGLISYMGRQPEQRNQHIALMRDGKIEGYCEYFHEFSEWRFGVMIYISVLYLKEAVAEPVIMNMFKFLYQKETINVCGFRFLLKDENDKKIMEVLPSAHLQYYDVMAIFI